MDKYNKKFISGLVIIAILALVYSIIYWVVPVPFSIAKLLTYIFTLISVGVCVLSYFIAFVKSSDAKSALYGFPISRVGFIYALMQMAVGILLLIASVFVYVEAWICIVIGVLMLGAALVGVIITDNSRDYIQNLDVKKTENIKAMKYFNADVTSVIEKCSDAEVKKLLSKLAEECKYSDPVSSAETEALEEAINDMIAGLSMEIGTMDSAAAIVKVNEIRDALRDRNRRCKLSKG